MESFDWSPVVLSLKLAGVTTLLLMLAVVPLAWWLSSTSSRARGFLVALSSLPLILPPTVLGFYLLLLLGANGPLVAAGLPMLAFRFEGLVIGSILYSLPFALQPVLQAFDSVPRRALEAAASMGASPLDRFFTIVLPQAKSGILTAAILCFAHTIGEFGVILMIGGNIPGETKVLSVAIYEHVEVLEYAQATLLSLGMLAFAFVTVWCLQGLNSQASSRR